MYKSLLCFAIFLPAIVINSPTWADDTEQAADDKNIVETIAPQNNAKPDTSSNSADNILERMPDKELLMMAQRIYKSKLAMAEMFNTSRPAKPEFANRREVIDYILASMAEKNSYGRR